MKDKEAKRSFWYYLKYFFDHFEEIMLFIILSILVTLAFVNVITRYFIKYSLAFTEEIEVNFFVWMTMFGAALAFKKKAHLGVSFIVNLFPPKVRKFFLILSTVLTVAVFVVLFYYSIWHVKNEIELDIRTMALNIPEWIYIVGVPFGSIIIIIRVIESAIKTYKEI